MIRVLVVDDQRIVAQAHREIVDTVPGFQAVAVACDGRTALARVARGDIDVVLLDLTMPGMDGLEVCRALNTRDPAPDVIAVTAVRDMAVVRQAVRHGAVLYVVKPFTSATLRARLLQYASFRAAATDHALVDQRRIDEALDTLRSPGPAAVPKTLSPESLDAVRSVLDRAPDGLTAAEVAERIGVARVTARRYLDHLVSAGTCLREPVYGHTGRPSLRYRTRANPT